MRRLSEGCMRRRLVLLARPCVIAALCLPGVAGCGSETSTRDGQDSATSAATAAPAQPASVTIRSSETPRTRSARKPQTDAAPRAQATPQFVACDPNISVRAATTTCAFAQNAFYLFFKDAGTDERNNAIDAYSPASRQS